MDADSESTARIAASIDAERSREGGANRSVLAGCAGQIVVLLAAAAVAFGALGGVSQTGQSTAFLILLVIGQFLATLVVTASIVKARGLGLVLALLPLLIIGSLAGIVGSEGEPFADRVYLVVVVFWVVAIGTTVAGNAVGRRWRWRMPATPEPRALTTATNRLERASSGWRRTSFTIRYADTDAGRLEMELDRRLAEPHGFRPAAATPKGSRRMDTLRSVIAGLASLAYAAAFSWGVDDPSVKVTYHRRSGP